jgi:hypothetical protein
MVAVEIRTERGFPQPRGAGAPDTRDTRWRLRNINLTSGNRTVKTADDRRHDNAGIGELTMRYGHLSQLARLDCTSSRRSTVMCALLRLYAVTTVYQRDSSSKRPLDRPSSLRFDTRTRHGRLPAGTNRSAGLSLYGRLPAPLFPRAAPTMHSRDRPPSRLYKLGFDNGSFHIS